METPITNDLASVVEGEQVVIQDKPPLIRMGDNGEMVGAPAPAAGTVETATDETAPDFEPVNDEEVRYAFRLLFEAHGWYFKHEHWTDDEAMQDIEMMIPAAVIWVNRIPLFAKTIKKVNVESFPLMFLYAWGKRFITSLRLKKQERLEKNKMTEQEATPYANWTHNGT